jgi:choline dehydrogenase-like flavoprotein
VSELGEHAVVLGAGMAGLLAARVLSEFYDSVTVVERDRLPDYPSHPQNDTEFENPQDAAVPRSQATHCIS